MSTARAPLKAPYPYFGGKASVARLVWDRFGDVQNYVEPFMGSAAILLNRPEPFAGSETVNDADGMIANFWRAVQSDPGAVAGYADWPVNENDLHARHSWLVGRRDSITAQLEGDPEWFDAKAAGWWVWGICLWIGSGWCSGEGPWQVVEVDGTRQFVHLGNAGRGVNRKLVHLGNAGQEGGDSGPGGEPQARGACEEWSDHLHDMMGRLSDRFRRVRVCCGDWSRIAGPTPTVKQGLTAVFLDPPYAEEAERTEGLYATDCLRVAHDVREWCLEWGDDPRMRIALCGYEGEHEMPASWECVAWKARGGFASQSSKHDNPNARRERIWFSKHCQRARDLHPLFTRLEAQ